jgi:hypothetical protein
MTDPTVSTLAGDYVTISVTIGATAESLTSLVTPDLESLGYKPSRVLQMSVLPNQPGVSTGRAAILYGGLDAQYGYLPAGDERVFPVMAEGVFVKRVGGSDVSAVIECFLRIVP